MEVRSSQGDVRAAAPSAAAEGTLTVRVAADRSELLAAYALVQRRYREKGYVTGHGGGLIYKPCFGLESSRTIVALRGSEIVGTMTVVGDNPLGLHVEEIYAREVDDLRRQGWSLAEVTCLCIAAEKTGIRGDVFTQLTRFAVHLSLNRGYEVMLLAVHPRHYRVYWHVFRAATIGPCRAFGSLGGSPAILCRIDLPQLAGRMKPRVRHTYFENVEPPQHYDGPPITAEDHELFCQMVAVSPDLSDNEDCKGTDVRGDAA